MRRELILVFLAISTMIVTAFVVPLGLSARATARDRALDTGRAQSAALVPLIATGDDRSIVAAVDAINVQGQHQVTIVLTDGTEAGASAGDRQRLDAVVQGATSLAGSVDGGYEIITAVVLSTGTAAVRIFIPDAELRHGVLQSWAILAALGAALVLGAVAIADRIAQRIISPASDLAQAATQLGAGDFTVHVEPSGPVELAATAGAFNVLVDRVRTMIEDERVMVAELTHRLRTPLTRLRVGLDQVGDEQVASKLHDDVEALTMEINDVILRARHKIEPPDLVDIASIVAQRFEFWSVLAADEGRDCALVSNESVGAVVEPDELEAAVDVLIENIFAHTPPGTSFTVATKAHADGSGSVIVEDAGPGFEPVMTSPGQSSAGSTGIGLVIVDRLVTRCGGTLTVGVSSLGGSRVECLFPRPN